MYGHRRNQIGGWLFILIFVVGVLTPLGQIGSVISLQQAAPQLASVFDESWPTYRAFALTIICLRTAVCLYIAWQLVYNRGSAILQLAIVGIWVSYVLLGAVSLVIASAFSQTPVYFLPTVSQLFWHIVISAVATAYLLKSRRVADTYSQTQRMSAPTIPE